MAAIDAWGQWMAAAQRGDALAYRQLLTAVRPWLLRWLARRLPPGQVEDAVQDVLIALHNKRHTFEPGRPFLPWLAAIARYRWIDRLRAMHRAAESELHDVHGLPDHGDAVVSATVLAALLARLKPAQAQVIRLVKLQGFSIEEAAAMSGQSASLVKVNIHRGLALLAAMVEDDPDD
jgi:RNA polymerase sigma-70 factor (ECF subfamily)